MRITVFQRSSPTRKTAPTTLIVENLDQSVTSVQLHTLLSRYGAVLCCEVAEGYMKSERFGVVKFYSKESAYFAPRLPFMNLPLGKGRCKFFTIFCFCSLVSLARMFCKHVFYYLIWWCTISFRVNCIITFLMLPVGTLVVSSIIFHIFFLDCFCPSLVISSV